MDFCEMGSITKVVHKRYGLWTELRLPRPPWDFQHLRRLIGLQSAESDWTKAYSDDTVVVYENFLVAHPKDSHVSEARAMILQLNDDTGWRDAQYAGTPSAYQTYLQRVPRSSHVVAANDEVTTFERSAAWESAQGTGTAAAIQAFMLTYPTGPEAAQAKAKLTELRIYRAHLAIESNFARAQREKDQLQSRLND